MNLHQGDCLEVLPSIPSDSVDMVFADLPYGVTQNRWDVCIDLGSLWSELLRIGKKVCAYAFTATQPFATVLINSRPKLFRYDLVWQKPLATGHLNANRCPLRAHECILLFGRSALIYNPQKTDGKPYTMQRRSGTSNYNKSNLTQTVSDGKRFPVSILSFSNDISHTHPTQKPVALLEWLIKTYTNEGDTVLDPTMGSGTTGVACRNTGRNFIGIEKELKYFQVAEERIARTK